MNTPSLPFDRSKLVLCSYGNQHAVGGPIESVTIIANTLINYDCSPVVLSARPSIAAEFAETGDFGDTSPDFNVANRRDAQVIPTHKTFGYVILTEAELVEVFYHLRHNAIPRSGKRANLRRAVEFARHLAHADFLAIERENFLGWNAGRNSFIADASEGNVVTVDGDGDWRADAFVGGSVRAERETFVASKS